MRFLQKLAEHSDVNKMSASNLAIVVGPNLLWSQGDRTCVRHSLSTFTALMLLTVNKLASQVVKVHWWPDME